MNRFAVYPETLEPIQEKLRNVQAIDMSIKLIESKYHVPTPVIGLKSSKSGRNPQDLLKQLIEGEPRVFMTYDANEDAMSINPINLQPGEGPVLGARLAEVLG